MSSFRPVAKRSLTDEVFAQLVGGIVTGDLAPGDPLPSERRLAEALGVSRPAVREALQRLSQSNLVEVRQGDTTTVRDYRRTAGPEFLPQLLLRDGSLDASVARSVVEVRAMLGPQVARLAAERAPDELAAGLLEVVGAMAAESDPVVLQRRALEFWDRLVDGADNIALRLMFNALRATYEPAIDVLAAVLRDEVSQIDGYRAIAAAVVDRQPARAEATARALLRPGTAAVLAALAALDD
jgi:GntR family transcriptional regulator, transcriptional repressor for pyruvate dehydrogenase complex